MQEIVIFGWSGIGKKLYEDFYEKGIAVSCVCDNSRTKRGLRGGYRGRYSTRNGNKISKCNLLSCITVSSEADEGSATCTWNSEW